MHESKTCDELLATGAFPLAHCGVGGAGGTRRRYAATPGTSQSTSSPSPRAVTTSTPCSRTLSPALSFSPLISTSPSHEAESITLTAWDDLALMYAVSQWNGYFDALLYLKSTDLEPLQLILRNILILNTTSSGVMDAQAMAQRQQMADLLKYCLVVVGSIPVLIFYPFVQRYFVKGMLIGSIKG